MTTAAAESKRMSNAKKEKSVLQDFEGQVKDIRQQLNDQLRCLELRTDAESAIFLEIQEYFKRRSEIELDYARNLEKLAKQVTAKHKAEKQKRDTWPLFSLYSWWQQLTEDTKIEARYRAVLADIYSNHVVSKLTTHSEQLQRISKRCREIGSDAHQEILRVLGELHTAMKTYQMCYVASASAETKFRTVETQKQRFEESFPKKVGNRKHRVVERELEKKQAKYLKLQLKALKSRNEYILCVEAANAALHKYFADDLSNLADCMTVGMNQWLSTLTCTILEARRQLYDANIQQDNVVKNWLQTFDARIDKRRFLETNHATFTLPRKFDFRAYNGDSEHRGIITADSFMEEDLRQRYAQLDRRLRELRTENEEIWKTYETAERKLIELQRQPELKVGDLFTMPPKTPPAPPRSSASASNILSNPVSASCSAIGILKNEPSAMTLRMNRNTCRETESTVQKRKVDLCEMEDFLLQKFRQYLLTSNLIRRLESRHRQIQDALGISSPAVMSESISSYLNNGGGRVGGHDVQSVDGFLDSCHSLTSSYAVVDGGDPNGALSTSTLCRVASKTKRKRVGRTVADTPRDELVGAVRGSVERNARLFGGSLEEYVEATGEEIPLVIRSCIRMLSMYGLHHQGVFRVSGSQLEINHFKEAFERGEDPLTDVTDSSDVNSVAGVLKLYFREMLEPLFPMFMFDQFVDCTRSESKAEVISKVKDLLKTLPRPVYVAMRYLFGFLNHLSEFSDENMMDPYNLAICFGPTLLPIPESRDQVFFHNFVNELMKNMIVYHEEIFPKDDPLLSDGMWYEKYLTVEDIAGCDQNEYEEDADGEERTHVEHGDEEKIVGSADTPNRENVINQVPYDETVTSAGPVTLGFSPTDSTEPDFDPGSPRRFYEELNLSNHASLQASPESPAKPLEAGRNGNEVWMRHQISTQLVDLDRPTDSTSSTTAMSSSRNSDGAMPDLRKPNSGPMQPLANSEERMNEMIDLQMRSTDRPHRPTLEWSKSNDADDSISSSSDPENPPIFPSHSLASSGRHLEVDDKFQSDHTSSYSADIPSHRYRFKNGDNSVTSASYGRHHGSISSEPSNPIGRRDCVVGPSKRLSLSSYKVLPNDHGTNEGFNLVSSHPIPGSQEDLEFIQQLDFSSVADGLSPTSLKEIQVELKAVLNSLESFTHHQISNSESTDCHISGIERPDLVQNLPLGASSAATPSSPVVQDVAGDNGGKCIHDEKSALDPPSDEGTSCGSPPKPPVPRKPVHYCSSQPVGAVFHQERDEECSSEACSEDAML